MKSSAYWTVKQMSAVVLVVPISLSSFAQISTHENEAAIQLATQVCARCHGARGDSPSPLVPRLAAQRVSYLKAEILDVKTHERDELLAREVMQSQVANLDNGTVLALALYYASQPPTPGTSVDPIREAKGKALFEQGSDDQVACATCHGQHAEGGGIFPRLAGQHAVYLRYQLRIERHGLRGKSVMHGMIDDLTEDDMANLASYLQSMP